MFNFRGAFMGVTLAPSATAPAVFSLPQPDPPGFSLQLVPAVPIDSHTGPAPWSRPYVGRPYPRSAFIAGRGVGIGPAPNMGAVSISENSC